MEYLFDYPGDGINGIIAALGRADDCPKFVQPTAIIIPSDLQEETYEPPTHAFKNVPSSTPGYTPSVTRAADDQIERAAEIINAGSKVAILVVSVPKIRPPYATWEYS